MTSRIINIRGTSGAGKTHLARRIMAHYVACTPSFVDGRQRPISLLLSGAPWDRPLFVLGHYDAPTGGADTVAQREVAFGLLTEARDMGADVLWEGVIYSDEVPRTVALCRGRSAHIIRLNTPIEACLESVRARRAERALARGRQPEPLSEANTRGRYEAILSTCGRLRDAGLTVVALDRDAAYSYAMWVLHGA